MTARMKPPSSSSKSRTNVRTATTAVFEIEFLCFRERNFGKTEKKGIQIGVLQPKRVVGGVFATARAISGSVSPGKT